MLSREEQRLDALASKLVEPHLLKSRDEDVELLVACCLADVFRIYAPEAPYTTRSIISIDTESPGISGSVNV